MPNADEPEKEVNISGVPAEPIDSTRAWKLFVRGVTTLEETRHILLDNGYPIEQVNALTKLDVDAVDTK